MKIMLDAGHGYSTSGKASPDGMKEYEFNRAVAAHMKRELELYEGVQVDFAHSDEEDVPLAKRAALANSLNVDCYVSIHANAAGNNGWSEAHGIETYIYITEPAEALSLAKAVQQQLIQQTGARDRGVKMADFQVLRETNMTAILIECGFMTNRRESSFLKQEDYRKKCASSITQGIVTHYSLRKVNVATNQEQPIYRVQLGAFTNRKNAEKLAKRLTELGFDAFVKKDSK